MPTFVQSAKKNTVSARGNKASRDVYPSLLRKARIAFAVFFMKWYGEKQDKNIIS